jgi:uncharacterized phage protein gp47/JayE
MAVDMDKWGISETGFYRPTIDDILSAKNTLAKQIIGEDFDTDELTPEGMLFRINAAAQSKIIQIAEGIYYSIFPHTARGVSLDRVCEVANLKRDSAGYAKHSVKVYGTQGYIIEAGTEFKNDEGIEFYSLTNAAIVQADTGAEGLDEEILYYADVIVQCKQSGTVGNVNDINSVVEVNMNIENVTYVSVVSYGTNAESDPELRAKFETVVQGLGTNTRKSIIANVLRVAGVNNVILLDNTTEEDVEIKNSNEEVVLTITAGTYAVIVQSDNATNGADIAQAIFEKQPLGIPQSGVEQIEILDSSKTKQNVKFSYVAQNSIDVEVTCVVDESYDTIGGEKEIQNNITTYINGLGIGQEVVYTRLYDYIYNVAGVKKVTSITLNGQTADIPINDIEIAKVGTITVDVEG